MMLLFRICLLCCLSLMVNKTLLGQKDNTLHAVLVTENEMTTKAYIDLLEKAKIKTKDGDQYHYFSKGKILMTQGDYSGHLLQGLFEKTNAQGQLIEKGYYKNGLKHGIWKSWNAEGLLSSTNQWKKGKRQGAFQEYDDQGQLARTGQYKDGKLHGKVSYYEGGTVLQQYRYKKGVLKN